MDNQHREIVGYRDLEKAEVTSINDVKAFEQTTAAILQTIEEEVKQSGDAEAGRWVSLARTHLETGFMFAIKAIARPTNGLGRKGG